MPAVGTQTGISRHYVDNFVQKKKESLLFENGFANMWHFAWTNIYLFYFTCLILSSYKSIILEDILFIIKILLQHHETKIAHVQTWLWHVNSRKQI